jgi:hypothetical protein
MKTQNIIFILLYLFLTNITSIFASLSIDKTFILFEKNNKNDTIRIYNQQNKKKNYQVSLVNYAIKEDGTYEILDTPSQNSANDLLVYTPKSITIDPLGFQIIRIQRKNTIDMPDGDYISFIMISEAQDPEENAVNSTKEKDQDNSIGVKIIPLFSISFPVVVRKGNNDSQVEIADASIVYKKNDLHLDATLFRSGVTSSRGSVNVKLGKQVIGQIKGINIFTNINKRNVSIPLTRSANLDSILSSKKENILTLEYVDEATGKVQNKYELKVK